MCTTDKKTQSKCSGACFLNKKDLNTLVSQTPCTNLEEKQDEYLITLTAPGVPKHELELYVESRNVSAQSNKTTLSLAHTLESKVFDTWKRSFLLPPDADARLAQAYYLKGELKVHIPKNTQPNLPVNIKVKVN